MRCCRTLLPGPRWPAAGAPAAIPLPARTWTRNAAPLPEHAAPRRSAHSPAPPTTWPTFCPCPPPPQVPTDYYSLWGRRTHTYQYSVTEYYHQFSGGEETPPAVYLL